MPASYLPIEQTPSGNSVSHEVAPPTNVRFAVTGWLAVAAVLAYLCRNSLVTAESQLRADLGITEEQAQRLVRQQDPQPGEQGIRQHHGKDAGRRILQRLGHGCP